MGEEQDLKKVAEPVALTPIGWVRSERREAVDDLWDSVKSFIELDPKRFTAEALMGLDSFPHVEVLFCMNQVDPSKIETAARHPRNNPAWPKVGISAQRGKNRPNPIGATICKVVRVDELRLEFTGLDAIDGTPLLDLKPWIEEFAPRGERRQPEWATELMRRYWE